MIKFRSIILILITFVSVCSCQKDPPTPGSGNKINLADTYIDAFTSRARVSTALSSTGGNTISQHGHCWSEFPDPTIDYEHTSLGNIDTAGVFSSYLEGLTPETKYFVRPYAINQFETIYGLENEFTTKPLGPPSVTTAIVKFITDTSAVCGGIVEDDGGFTVTDRGICWNTSGYPTLANCLGSIAESSGPGSFTITITDLNKTTRYYVSAYAINEKGATYGNILSFKTLTPCGDLVIDYGGYEYHTVKIGDQCWLKENLNIGTRINGIQGQQNNQTIEKYCYDDNEANCNSYGGL